MRGSHPARLLARPASPSPSFHDHVLRNHSVGSRCSLAASGPDCGLDADQDVSGLLGVSEEDVEVAVVVEDAGVEQLVLELLARPPAVCLHQIPVRELALRILVQIFHV